MLLPWNSAAHLLTGSRFCITMNLLEIFLHNEIRSVAIPKMDASCYKGLADYVMKVAKPKPIASPDSGNEFADYGRGHSLA